MRPDGLSIIIPTYNEEPNIGLILERLTKAMENQGIKYEIIFIDDHSKDKTQEKIIAFKNQYPVNLFQKVGKKGKGYSIIEGFEHASFEYIAMLDADLQYPPEIIPKLYQQAKIHGFAVANRKTYQSTLIRKIASRINAFVFGRLLLNLKTDVQSGLKIFKREVFEHLNPTLVSSWGTDIPLVFTAFELGLKGGTVDIDFRPRINGKSNVRFLKTALEIAVGAIKTRFSNNNKIYHLKPNTDNVMLNAGIAYKRRRFITHSTLRHENSALITFTFWQKAFLLSTISFLILGMTLNAYTTVVVFVAVLSTIYFFDVIFNLVVVLKSLHFPPEIKIENQDMENMDEKNLPLYSILCPLYHEAKVLPQFISAMSCLDWPKDKLEVLLLLEENDSTTIEEANKLNLPIYFKKVIVPASEPKTKPKACNYGLGFASGEYLVVYDAEDKPDPMQLKKAYLAFAKTTKDIACLQAKLNYYNPHHNLLTRFFTAEYSLWFDVILPGLQSINTSIPLGGTSNHFRTQALIGFKGWDPFNVTEDCDLGIRLFKTGYKTAIIDSTTLEEANSNLKNWFRQRSRWIKGYLQTYLVHMRNPIQLIKNHGIHAFIFQLIVGGKIAFMLINPILWLITISYFTLYSLVGPTIESLYPTVIFYMAVFSILIGNFICLYNYMIGCAKRGHWDLIKYIYFVPFYWLMISFGAGYAVFQLFIKPHYWEKTIHGFHLQKAEVEKRNLTSGSFLVFASLVGNFFNFLYNAYLSRRINLEDFGLINLLGSFIYLAHVPFGAISRTVTHHSAYLLGKYENPVKEFWVYNRKKVLKLFIIIAFVWLILTPILLNIFQTEKIFPFFIFTPVWIIGALAAVDSGFLRGTLKFSILAVITIIEAAAKLFLTVVLVSFGKTDWIYTALPLSMLVSFFIGWLSVKKVKGRPVSFEDQKQILDFPIHFFNTSILLQLSTIAFLGLDVVLAKIFLSPLQASQYVLISLIGKMVYFISSLFGQFLVPLVSHAEGVGKKSSIVFQKLLLITTLSSIAGFIIFGLLGEFTAPLLWGNSANDITSLLPLYSIGMVFYVITMSIVSYHQIRKEYAFPFVSLLLGIGQIIGIIIFHNDVEAIVRVVAVSGYFSLIVVLVMHIFYNFVLSLMRIGNDLIGLFGRFPKSSPLLNGKLRILIFNWRDTKHVWSGGAESYVFELAKYWVKSGNNVTIFCGNDSHSLRHEVIDGVQIIRRGGFYFVYVWAFFYYIFRLRGKYDVIIDSENGIPFFTSLYARIPVFLLIYHVHQEVFRENLAFPFSKIARFMEAKLTPIAYKNNHVITISESSRRDIVNYGIAKQENIEIVHPGIDESLFYKSKKSKNPSFLCLGRLKQYKNIDIAIHAFAKVVKHYPQAELSIVGEGEMMEKLQALAKRLKIQNKVIFYGKISESDKAILLSQAWVVLQPSQLEGWGITIIEANASATPVIASNVPGLSDSIIHKETGILVELKNIDAFANAMTDLIQNQKYRETLSDKAFNWAQNFNWDKSSEQFLNIIENALVRPSVRLNRLQLVVSKVISIFL